MSCRHSCRNPKRLFRALGLPSTTIVTFIYYDSSRLDTKRSSRVSGLRFLFVAFVITALSVPTIAIAAASKNDDNKFNRHGNLLITDQFNNRVVEINRETKSTVWSFGSGDPSLCNPGPGAIIGTNDAERLADDLTVMVGTGIPPVASLDMPNGFVDNRVIVV